jgi:hypothetical protein
MDLTWCAWWCKRKILTKIRLKKKASNRDGKQWWRVRFIDSVFYSLSSNMEKRHSFHRQKLWLIDFHRWGRRRDAPKWFYYFNSISSDATKNSSFLTRVTVCSLIRLHSMTITLRSCLSEHGIGAKFFLTKVSP